MTNRFLFLKFLLANPVWKFKHQAKAHRKVNNCEDAAIARKIELHQELKSIILNVNDELFAFHFRGNEILQSRKIAKYLRVLLNKKIKKIRFANTNELKTLNSENIYEIVKGTKKIIDVQKGTVTPLNENIWNLYTFISPTLFNNNVVFTNDGTLNGQIEFNPRILKLTPNNNYVDKNIFEFTKNKYSKMSKYAHKAWHGVLDHIEPKDLEDQIEYFANESIKEGFKKSKNSKYQFLRIMDTFFSDTFNCETLIKLIQNSKNKDLEYSIQILLLNPFSESASNRAQALKNEDKIKRLNRGLYKIKKAIQGENINDPDNDFLKNNFNPEFIYKQLEQIEEAKRIEGFPNLEVKFEKSINYPLFSFSHFSFTTQYFKYTSSKNNQWQLIVDDPNKDSDYYDVLRRDFIETWGNSKRLLRSEIVRDFDIKNVFISYGHDIVTRSIVMNFVNNNDFNSITFDKAERSNDDTEISSILKEMYKICASSIHILTKDDELKSGKTRARQNVILELGYSQKSYENRVLVIAEKGIEIPSNLSGYKLSYFTRDRDGNPIINEADVIKFLEKVKRNLEL